MFRPICEYVEASFIVLPPCVLYEEHQLLDIIKGPTDECRPSHVKVGAHFNKFQKKKKGKWSVDPHLGPFLQLLVLAMWKSLAQPRVIFWEDNAESYVAFEVPMEGWQVAWGSAGRLAVWGASSVISKVVVQSVGVLEVAAGMVGGANPGEKMDMVLEEEGGREL